MGTGIYAITGSEAGVGRTTTTLQLGMALERAGYNVVVADVDLEMAGLVGVLGFRPGATVQDVLTRAASINDAIVDGPGGLTIVPADPEGVDINEENPKLERVIEPLIAAHDIVLLDTPPKLHPLNRAIIEYADGVVIATTADVTAADTVEKLVKASDILYTDVLGLVVTHTDEMTDVASVVTELDQPAITTVPVSTVLADSPSHEDVEPSVKAAYDRLGAVVGAHVDGEPDENLLALTVPAARAGEGVQQGWTPEPVTAEKTPDAGTTADEEGERADETPSTIRDRLSGLGSRVGGLLGGKADSSSSTTEEDEVNPLDELEDSNDE